MGSHCWLIMEERRMQLHFEDISSLTKKMANKISVLLSMSMTLMVDCQINQIRHVQEGDEYKIIQDSRAYEQTFFPFSQRMFPFSNLNPFPFYPVRLDTLKLRENSRGCCQMSTHSRRIGLKEESSSITVFWERKAGKKNLSKLCAMRYLKKNCRIVTERMEMTEVSTTFGAKILKR